MARTWTAQSDYSAHRIDYPSSVGLLYEQTAATIALWFKSPTGPTSGAWPTALQNYGAFNRHVTIQMPANDQGKIKLVWRAASGLAEALTSTRYDDDTWYRAGFVRRNSSPYIEIFINGSSVASSTTDPGTGSDALIERAIGNSSEEGAFPLSGWNGALARIGIWQGLTLTPTQIDSFLLNRTYPNGTAPDLHMELLGESPEPDWSGNARDGTVVGTSAVNHPPLARLPTRYSIYFTG